jgi:GNAT superfamily N-acetyltransferase
MVADLLIRLAQPAERDRLEALQLRASLMWEEYRDALLTHPDAIALPIEQIMAGRTHVAERRGELVGFSVVLPRNDGDAELDGLFVEPTVWRRGVGTRLVQQAQDLALCAGSAFLCVIANPHAEGFYAACGFELVGEEQTRFGIGLKMRKALTTT